MVTDKNEAMFVHICDSGCKDGKHRPIPEAELTTSGGPEIWISTNPNFRVVPNRGNYGYHVGKLEPGRHHEKRGYSAAN